MTTGNLFLVGQRTTCQLGTNRDASEDRRNLPVKILLIDHNAEGGPAYLVRFTDSRKLFYGRAFDQNHPTTEKGLYGQLQCRVLAHTDRASSMGLYIKPKKSRLDTFNAIKQALGFEE